MENATKTMKRLLSFVLALLMVFSLMPQVTLGASAVKMTGGEKLYLTPNANWKNDNARYAIYVFGSGEAWASMTKVDGETDLYEVTVPDGDWTNVIFCRMNPSASANNWNNKWNQTADLTYDGTKNHYTVKAGTWDSGGGTWSVYTPPCDHTNTTENIVESTCTVAGSKTVTCDACGEVLSSTALPLADHTYEKGGATCDNCSEPNPDYKEPAEECEHTYDPACSDTCKLCGEVIREAQHTFEKGGATCDTCDEPNPNYEEPVKDVTVYCINSSNWAAVSAYVFDENGTYSAEWPGAAMTKTGETVNGFDVYSATFDAKYGNVIFNNNSNGSQTADLTVKAGQYYDVKTATWYASLSDVPAVDTSATDVYLVGEFNGWSTVSDEFKKAAAGDTTATVTMELGAETTYEFKIVNAGAWTSCGSTITGDVSGLAFSSAVGDNSKITTAAAGEYVFTYDLSANTLSVTYPEASVEPEEPETYSVGFVMNGGTPEITSQTVTAGQTAAEPAAPTRDGYDFEGWYTDEARTEKFDFTTPISSDLTLYANWTEQTVVPEEPGTVTIYFQNNWMWEDVSVYYWGASDGTDPVWHGYAMELAGNDGNYDIYTYEIPTDITGMIINGLKDDGSGNRDQTPDITEGFYDGICYYMMWNDGNVVGYEDISVIAPDLGGSTDPEDPAESFIIYFDPKGVEYDGIIGTLATCEHEDGYRAIAFTWDETSGKWVSEDINEKGYICDCEERYVSIFDVEGYINGTSLLNDTLENGKVYSVPAEEVSYAATFHFINTLNWETVNLYTWIGAGTQLTGGWPGTAVPAKGGYNTATVEFEAAEGTDLNFIFNNGSTQTIDLTLPASAFTKNDEGVYVAEKYVALTTQTDGKYDAAIVDAPEAIVTSPIVDGSSVTFNYGNNSAASVSVAGSFNEWNATATPMTKNAEGVWTATVENLEAGEYQYKFVVDGKNWILDPMNGNVITDENENQNSAFYILSDESQEDDNKVIINIHYTRDDGNYENWNLWVWGSAIAGHQVDFETTDENGAVVATIVLENARDHQSISFKERLSVEGDEWADQGSNRSIDLSTIVSGTIDYYIPSGNIEYTDVIRKNKIKSVELDYDNGVVEVVSVQAIPNAESALKLVKTVDGETVDVGATITAVGSKYSLALPEGMELKLSELYLYQVDYYGSPYAISMDAVYASDKFAEEFTYEGKDLGATYTGSSTTFKVWAPTAESVGVKLFTTGSDLEEGAAELGIYEMTMGDKGVWTVTIDGDLKNVYYTYLVMVDGEEAEAVDPYARATGVNGNRAMVIELDSTDPQGWASDKNPNPVSSQTDAIIYELHVRDFSIDDSSGVSEANRGKYLAFDEEGTTVNGEGNTSTGIDYLDDLGITHLHLLPVYDYGSVNEITSNKFNWGYDPVNYNVPEGSYSSNPYDGNVRVYEFKQMVKSLHDRDISVVMDVVYNHVYDADEFCFNNIVPGYFSRKDSNASGCGNDTASEREMVRKYIVESVLYWAEEYHIDGFRFDLVGLLDVETINQIVTEVHKIRPDVIFYGEGWDMDGTNKEPGTQMAKQGNASKTPGFAYFSDSIRNGLGGSNGTSTGFASGAGNGGSMVSEWMANPWWTNNPEQVIQYASCHDNYTLIDKIVLSTGRSKIDDTVIKMNNLAAAFYMTAQGVPFIHAGEEFLREKLYENGEREENSYNKGDYVNHIEWSNLEKENYAANSEYYQGLIAFRKAHPALRMDTAAQVKANVYNQAADANLVSFWVDGRNISGESHDSIYVIFNAAASAATVELPAGDWDVCVNGETAGTAAIETVSGSVSVDGISAMVLVQEESTEEPSSTKSDVALPGSFNGWNQGSFMETTDDKNIVTLTLSLPAGTYEFKVKNGDAWLSNGGTIVDTTTDGAPDGWDMTASVSGNCKLQASGGAYTFKFNLSTGKLIVEHDPNGGEFGDPNEYYLFGYINGADYAMGFETGEYKFDENGSLTTTFTADSYVMVKNGDCSKQFMADGYPGAVTSATLYDTSKHTVSTGKVWDKMLIPGGVEVTITMVMNDNDTITLSYEIETGSNFVDASGIQKGVTLHAWNWSFDEIADNMATIAAQGYTAVQTSPIQVMKEATNLETNSVGSHWWVYYQPVDFKITTDEGNALGTKADFEAMCKVADQYGIKVIVDVVANHLGNKTGNDLADAVPEYLRKDEYWHDITTDITNWNDRYNMTQYCLSGLPDLNTANKDIQGYVLKFLKECVDAGADGFRFDMAKSIETPKDDATFASDFWPTVVNGIQEYAGNDLYIYGEILDNAVIPISAYTEYMSVTDNGWGNHMRTLVAGGTAELVAGFYKSAPASNLVIWAESHDTFADKTSSGVSEENINKTWALVAARKDAMGLYLARPESMEQALGVASDTGWANEEVKAANKFHNDFAGESETIGNSGKFAYVVRGTEGIVIVNAGGTTAEVTLTVPMTDGTYTDQITGNTFTVADGVITGSIGSTGIAVVCAAEEEAEPYITLNMDNMELGNNLALIFWVKKAEMLEDVDYTAKLIRTFADGTTEEVAVPESQWTALRYNGEDYYQVKYNNFAAKEMLDEISIQIFDADGKAVSNIFTDSIREYAMFALGAYTDAAYAEFRTAMVDMLNYGAAAQKQFGYNTDDLANSELSAEQQAQATQSVTLEDHWTNPNGIGYGSNLELISNIVLHVWLKGVTSDMYAEVSFTSHTGETVTNTVAFSEFNNRGNGLYSVPVNGLVVADGGQVATVELYKGDGTLVGTVTESVESYINFQLTISDANGLYDATAKFITSAYNYFH